MSRRRSSATVMVRRMEFDMSTQYNQVHPRFVLIRTSHPGNIGASARAIRTMGFTRLALVAPERYPHPEATALAAGAGDVLELARVSAELTEALTGASLILGLSVRRRGVQLPELSPRAAAERAHAAMARGEQVAFLFGHERTGLENEELARCHAMVRIPSVSDYGSLNLSHAVQLMAYELRLQQCGEPSPETMAPDTAVPADAVQMEQFFRHLGDTLGDIEFHKGRAPTTLMLRLRKLFQRAQPDARELRILHGILADAQRMAKLAKGVQ